jgi:hypothetical protein
MRLNTPIHLVCADDGARPHLSLPYLDAPRGVIVATNGHALAVVKTVTSEGDASGYLPVAAIKEAQRARGDLRGELHANGSVKVAATDTEHKRPELGRFPEWERVVPTGRTAAVRIGLDPRLLLALAKAIGSERCISVTIYANHEGKPDPSGVMRVDSGTDDSYGVIMPCRV